MRKISGYGHFQALLRNIRLEAGLHQDALAKILGKPQTFVSKSELGERRLDFLETIAFCKACNVSLRQFLTRLDKSIATTETAPRKKRRSPRKMDSEGRVTD